jgi:hypothetical protein
MECVFIEVHRNKVQIFAVLLNKNLWAPSELAVLSMAFLSKTAQGM